MVFNDPDEVDINSC